MQKIPVIAIFDIGKTNKKILLFDDQYNLVFEETKQLEEIKDEDQFPCEDLNALAGFIKNTFSRLLKDDRYEIKAVNVSAYGASFVYLDESLNVIPPLYNYLKPYSPALKEKFYSSYGGESYFARTTASPVLGNLNSGMQIYRLKYEKPESFAKIKHVLHLPQYISFILTNKIYSDITSIGCHTNLWDFENNKYHSWVTAEGIAEKLSPIIDSDKIATHINETILAGIGLHDSSAALIPYLISFNEPFVLLSTGTWCITLNPFNNTPLTDDELQQDCLCYLSYQGKRVKASRLFAGYEHEQETKKLSEHFNKPFDYYKTLSYDLKRFKALRSLKKAPVNNGDHAMIHQSDFASRDLNGFADYEEAYHQLIEDIVAQQFYSSSLVFEGTGIKRIFVDGGFSNNQIYMNTLARAFPGIEVYATSVPQASALGAALVIHKHWNSKTVPPGIIELQRYPPNHEKANQ